MECFRNPEVGKCDNRIQEDRVTALCMLLARHLWSHRLANLQPKFGWKPERISCIVTTILKFIYDTCKHLLHFDAARLTPEKLVTFTVAIQRRDTPVDTLEQYTHAPGGRDLHIYADAAYSIGGHLIILFQ